MLLLFLRTTNQWRKTKQWIFSLSQTWVDLGGSFDATFIQVARFRIRKLHNSGRLESYFKISQISQSVHCCTYIISGRLEALTYFRIDSFLKFAKMYLILITMSVAFSWSVQTIFREIGNVSSDILCISQPLLLQTREPIFAWKAGSICAHPFHRVKANEMTFQSNSNCPGLPHTPTHPRISDRHD